MSKNLHDKFFVIFTAIAIFKIKKNVCEKKLQGKKENLHTLTFYPTSAHVLQHIDLLKALADGDLNGG